MEHTVVANEAVKLRAWSEMLNHAKMPWDAMRGIGTALIESYEVLEPELDVVEAAGPLCKIRALGFLLAEDPRPSLPPDTGLQGLKLLVRESADEMTELAEWLAEESKAA